MVQRVNIQDKATVKEIYAQNLRNSCKSVKNESQDKAATASSYNYLKKKAKQRSHVVRRMRKVNQSQYLAGSLLANLDSLQNNQSFDQKNLYNYDTDQLMGWEEGQHHQIYLDDDRFQN